MGGTYVYVDALNVYHGTLKRTPYKWLDYEALVRELAPSDTITKIRYFTARIKPLYPGDKAHERQNAYLRAVAANPLIETTLGHFRQDTKWRVLAERHHPLRDLFRPCLRPLFAIRMILADATRRCTEPGTKARVIVREEKGSDVSLAAYLVYDALSGNSDAAIVISNDSDLAEAIRLVEGHGIPVRVVNPHRQPTSAHLVSAASGQIQFDHGAPARCQLPNPIIGANGRSIHKPKEW